LLEKGYAFNEAHFWDNREDYLGYFNTTTRNGSYGSGKSFNATVDAITTHLYNLYLLTGDEKYALRLTQLAQNMLDYLAGNMATQKIGFPEEFDTSWGIYKNETRTIMGHVLKTGWCLARIYKLDPRPEYLQAAEQLVNEVLDKGYDHVNGGPYKDYDRLTGEMMMYGAYDKAKAWWQMEQAITSGLLLFEITQEQKYLTMADESLDFFMRYFVDAEYGEVYADRSETGGRVNYSGGYWDENKGTEGKAAYHSIETAYYAYMYGSILVNNQAFSLNYNYSPLDSARVFKMNPLALDFDHFIISSVTLNGAAYTNFEPNTRLLNLPANTGGHFVVTYESTKSYVADVPKLSTAATQAALSIFPNPTNGLSQIQFYLPQSGSIQLRIYDLNGKLKELKELGLKNAGTQHLEWNFATYKQGIYLMQLITNNEVMNAKISVVK
jgi:hypothetical protein